MHKAWGMHVLNKKLAVGYDDGCIVLQIGQEIPLFSFLKGKMVLCKSSGLVSTNLKAVLSKNLKNFEEVTFEEKELGTTDLFPRDLSHSPNGQYFYLTDGAEFAVHKAQTGKQTTFGTCNGILWSPQNQLCVLENDFLVKFLSPMGEEVNSLQLDFYVEKIFPGRYLGIVGIDFIVFYDYESLQCVGKIDAAITNVKWPVKQDRFVVGTPEGFYLLDFEMNDEEEYSGEEEAEMGDFEVVQEYTERFTSGIWAEGVFLYLKDSTKLCLLGLAVSTVIISLPFRSSLVGFLGHQNKLYLMSEKGKLYTVSLSQKLLKTIFKLNEAQKNEDEDAMKKVLTTFKSIEAKDYDFLAKILLADEKQELAFQIVKDLHLKFEIALKEKLLNEAMEICVQVDESMKWKRLGDEALLIGKFLIAKKAFLKANDLNSLIMLGSSLGDSELMQYVGRKALQIQHFSAAFSSFWMLRDLAMCHQTLIDSKRYYPYLYITCKNKL